VRPNRAVKAERASGRQYDPEIRPMRERYWKVFGALLAADPDFAAVVTRHGGAAGHLTLFPDARFRAITPRVNVLAYLSLGAGQRLAYVHVRPNPEESPESWHPRITALRAELAEVLDRPLEGDWSSDTGLHNLASRHLAQVKTALQALTRAFAPEAEAADPR
jgi:hypothetical protein